MHPSVKRFLISTAPTLSTYARATKALVMDKNSYLHSSGWLRSLQEGRPVSQAGDPVPWMNYAVVALLRERLKKDLRLFEYGSGQSTSFFASLVSSVTSVEYDPAWESTVRAMVPSNVQILYRAADVDGEYCRTIRTCGETFDVVVIDGWDRVNCIKQGISSVSGRGVLILDDSQRVEYQEGLDFALHQGYSALPIEGLKPVNNSTERTTLFYRPNNCLGI